MTAVDIKMLLPCNERITFPKFKQKFLQMIYQSLFQIRFIEVFICRKIQKLQYIRILDYLFIFRLWLKFVDLICNTCLIFTCKNSLVVKGIDLAVQLS